MIIHNSRGMAETLSCPDCGTEVESAEQLVAEHEVTELDVEDGAFNLFGSRDLYLCEDCRTPLGVGHSEK